jgi:hypothetical protein
MRRSRRARVYFCFCGTHAALALACAGSTPNSPPHHGAARGEPARDAAPAQQKSADLVLAHWPSLSVRSIVEVHTEGRTRVLRVSRPIPGGVAAGWRVHFTGEAARIVDGIVHELATGSHVEASCPRRRGRDGVSWIVSVPARRMTYGVDFQMTSAEPECSRFEAAAVHLMKLAHLRCVSSACLRPEEVLSGRLSCAPGEAGRECREAPSLRTSDE